MFWSYKEDIQLWVNRISPPFSSPVDRQLLLLHDALGSIRQWKSFPQKLAEQLQAEVILYERQGHGRSSPLASQRHPDFFHREALEVLPAFIQSHQLEDAVIMGHSDGATIALLYAAQHRPKGVIAVAPHIFVEDITLKGIQQGILQKNQLIPKLQKYHGDKTEALFNAWADTWTAPEFRRWNIQEELSGIRCPLLLIQGEQDEYGSLKQLEGIREVVPHAVISLLPGVRHMPQIEAEKEVVSTIKDWLLKNDDQ